MIIGCCPSNIILEYFQTKFLSQLLTDVSKIEFEMTKQPESILSENIICCLFKDTYSKQLAV